MKLTLKATVRAINPTESSCFVNGVQDVTLQADDGKRTANLVFPLASHEHTRELGALYWKQHAVTITIEAGEPEEDASLSAENERLRATVQKLTKDYQAAQERVKGDALEIDGLRAIAMARFNRIAELEAASRTVLAPPLVHGRPSCCENARCNTRIDHRGGAWSISGLDGYTVAICVFCPYCGAKLPEVTP